MGARQELLQQAEEEFDGLKAAIKGLDEGQMREIWLGSWGVREILAHISGWHRELGPALSSMQKGERPIPEGVSYDDVDAWNARFADARRAASTGEILAELDASHAVFMRAAAGVPEERFVPGKTAHKIVDFTSRHHYQEHREQIEAWRKSRAI